MGYSYPLRMTPGALITGSCVFDQDLVSKAVDFLIQNGVIVDITSINLSGTLTRADEIDRLGKKDCAYGVHLDAPATAWCMNWRTGEKASCVLQGKTSPLDRAVLRERAAIRDKALEEELATKHAVAAAKARAIYESSKVGTKSHPYCVKKGLEFGPEVRRCTYLNQDCLVVPLYGEDSQLWSLLFIGPGKVFHGGEKDKTLLTGGRKKGSFFPLGSTFRGAKRVLVGEGIATVGAAVRATGLPGVMAMDKGNLVPVATIVKAQAAPDAEIVILADDDLPETGGFQCAKQAAELVGGYVAEPSLGKNADFWDLWHELGDEAVLDRINRALGSRLATGASELVIPNDHKDVEDTVWACGLKEPDYLHEVGALGGDEYARPCGLEEPGYLHEDGALGVEEYASPCNLEEPIDLHRVEGSADFRGFEESVPTYELQASSLPQVLHVPSGQDDGEDWLPIVKPWPTLERAALPDIIGEFVDLATDNSEADPVAVLATLLVRFGVESGSPTGRDHPYFMVGESRHEPRINCVVTGRSSKARKGTSGTPVSRLFRIDASVHDLPMAQVSYGPLSSGEGLYYAVRDPTWDSGKGDKEVEIFDVESPDKRLYIQEEEFVAALIASKRNGNTLSAALRGLWDGGQRNPLTKNKQVTCTGPHIGVLAHITLQELKLTLPNVDIYNGFANRFIWVLARRPRLVPMPEPMPDEQFTLVQNEVLERLRFAHGAGRLLFSEEAKIYWGAIYPDLTAERSGAYGAITSRSEAQVIRLAMIYALFGASSIIETEHIQSALAFWKYADASAEYIFSEGSKLSKLEDKLRLLLEAESEGLSLTELHARTQNHVKAADMKNAMQRLCDFGLVTSAKIKKPGAIRQTTLFKIDYPAAKFAN